MKRNYLIILVFALSLLLVLSACGKDEAEAPAGDVSIVDTQTPPPVLSDEIIEFLGRVGLTEDALCGRQLIIVKSVGTDAFLCRYEASDKMVWSPVGNLISAKLGRNGVTSAKAEGDLCTPAGLYYLGDAFGIEDKPQTKLNYRSVSQNSYWVDDPDSPDYNTWVELEGEKTWKSAEHLADYNPQYALGVIVKYNCDPIVPGAGSAIFLHCGDKPTAGCVAVDREEMLEILSWLDPDMNPMILIV